MTQNRTANLFRMVLLPHACSYGERAKLLLLENGYHVDNRILRTRAEVDAFERDQGVSTAPQIFIDGERIGGNNDRE